jgi:Major tropism determinant N-terminal domain
VTLIQLRRGTDAEWMDIDPILAAGEPGVDPAIPVLKIGDGVLPWSLLPQISGAISDDGVPVWPPYQVQTNTILVDGATGGDHDVLLFDGVATIDGWAEVLVGGGYAGSSASSVNVRQGVYASSMVDPTGQPWIAFGYMASPGAGLWESIGDCFLSIPVTTGQGLVVYWRGNWSPASEGCSFRGNVTLKLYSAAGQPIAIGPPGPQGPPGSGGGGGGEAYRHVQSSAATTWTVPHNLSFRPNVAAVDSTGRQIVPGAVDYTSSTTVVLTFSAAVGGEAYCS